MISNKTINAIDLCVLLAGNCGECLLSTSDLSKRLGLSVSYIETILKSLKDHGLVSSTRGPGGGYKINGDASLICIWEVAKIFEKSVSDTCSPCELKIHEKYEIELNKVVIDYLTKFTLADFTDTQSSESKSDLSAVGFFKFKPLPTPLIPRAPNSVFQLGLTF